jgi:hypothetical protein
MKAIFVLTPVIVLLCVPTFAAAQQISNTILDKQELCDLPEYTSCHSMGFVAVTQTNSSSTNTGAAPRNSSSIVPQFQLAKVLLEDAIQSLQNNDTNRALIRLNLADQQISSSVAENLSSAQIIKVLLEDAIQSLQNNDTNRARASKLG